MKKILIIKTLIFLCFSITIAVNALANLLPINGITTGQVSDAIPIYFIPAGYVFSIWGLIYLGLLLYAFYTLKDFQKEDVKIFPWFVISSISNMFWIILWHYQFVYLSVLPMLLILISLIAIYNITDTEKYNKIKRIPFQIYLGWISVATIANISGALHLTNWNGFGIPEEIWAVVMIGVATKLAIFTTTMKKDMFFSLVIIWAIVGILVNFFSKSDLVTGACFVSIMAIAMNIFTTMYIKKT
jgi:hypothetical protein